MKMVKSLLLGSAAGLVAIVGAQAADLPVKAKPVQYVKICSLYGVGFYYIPGTDMCIKVGGWLREEKTWGYNGSISVGPVFGTNLNNRSTSDDTWRTRGYITIDARNQTPYGTVRAYMAVGLSGNNSVDFNSNRAFIQWAGFTFGLAQSFFDFYNPAATQFGSVVSGSDTGDGGLAVNGYTAQFGNGLSASIALENGLGRRTSILDQTAANALGAAFLPGTTNLTSAYGGFESPDIVANLRVDQAWGSAQVMGALHQLHSVYYGGSETNGHPGDDWGFAVGGGLKLNAPMISKGDFFQSQFTYTEGAMKYAANNATGNPVIYDGNSVGFGVLTDAVYGGTTVGGAPATVTTGLNLTTAWSANAAYEHFWNSQWKTSIWGAYLNTTFNAQANAMLCAAAGGGTGVGSTAVAVAGCDNDYNVWGVGSRTQWNITSDFYMGLEVFYYKLESASSPRGTVNLAANSTKPAGLYTLSDQDGFAVRWRVHKDFYP